MTWHDDGVRFKLYTSTAGDFVSLGERTPYPFEAGGVGGVPLNWTYFSITSSPASDVNITTQDGRFSISNTHPTETRNGLSYGARRDFAVKPNTSYIFNIQTRTMDGKSAAVALVYIYINGVGIGGINAQKPDSSWEQLSIPFTTNSAANTLRIELRFNPYWALPADARPDWGLQYQNPSLVEMPQTPPQPEWHEVTCDSFTFTARHGRNRFTSRYEVASCAISVRNAEGDYSYQPVHPFNLRPGRFVKVVGTLPGESTDRPMFYGIIDSLTDGYAIDGRAVTNLSCIDVSSLLSNVTVPTAESDGTVSLSGMRFRTLTRAVGWSTAFLSYTGGEYYQQAILANGRTVRDELGLIADSEGGYFYADRNGNLVYRDRDYAPSEWTEVQAELLAQCADYVQPVKFVLPGVNGNAATIPDEPGITFTVATTIAALVTLHDLDSASAQTFISKSSAWYFRKTAGARTVQAKFATLQTSTAPLPFNNGDTFWVRAVRTSVGGLTFATAPYNGTDDYPTTAQWTQLGDPLTDTGTPPTLANEIAIGAFGASLISPVNGRILRLRVVTGGIVPLEVRPRTWAVTEGATIVPLSSGQTMTVRQTGDNVLVQADASTPPNQLVPVDNVPTRIDPAFVFLQALATDWSRDRVVNDVQLANQGGGAMQFVDDASQKKYGPRTYQRLDFLNDNSHPEYLIERSQDIMSGFTESLLRVNSVDFRPDVSTYAWAMGVFLNDLVRVRYTNSLELWGWAIATHVQAVQHTVTTKDWQVQLVLDQPESFNRWEGGGGGSLWDEGAWDEAMWDTGGVGEWSRGAQWSREYAWGQ